jgi:hypothetical protein
VKAPVISRCYDSSMPELFCTARRVGNYESRIEEYELAFTVGDAPPKKLRIKYQAARAYEINAALDSCVEAARAAVAETDPDLVEKPTDESLTQLSWKTMQSAKYEEGEPRTFKLGL